jgi:RNA polymerase sigma factor (sigma-70 family)
VYQAARCSLLIVVTVLDTREISEATVTVGGAETERPGEVWGQAASAFERWAAGDAVALDELVRVMTPVLWHVVRAYRLTTEVAEDVVQTTWLSLVRSRDGIQDPAAVGGWLTTTARREAWRVAKASGRALPVEDDELARRLPDEGSAEAEVVRRDDDSQLWGAVERLSERCQQLLRIVAFEHRPDYTRIAADLGMPVGSIGPTRGRCLQKLRAIIEKDEDGDSDD